MRGQVEQVSLMKRRPAQPSRRLLAAAAAEHAGIERQRQQLLARRRTLHAQIVDLDAALAELSERALLIERLAGEDIGSDAPASTAAQSPRAEGKTVLRGPAIRRTAVTILLSDPRHPQALHYREWFALLEQNGYAVAGKDPLAVFLTQLSRSPVVQRGTQSGVYELSVGALAELRRQLDSRQRELATLTSPSAITTNLSTVRSQRSSLTKQIDKLEKALEEAEVTLGTDAERLAAAG